MLCGGSTDLFSLMSPCMASVTYNWKLDDQHAPTLDTQDERATKPLADSPDVLSQGSEGGQWAPNSSLLVIRVAETEGGLYTYTMTIVLCCIELLNGASKVPLTMFVQLVLYESWYDDTDNTNHEQTIGYNMIWLISYL